MRAATLLTIVGISTILGSVCVEARMGMGLAPWKDNVRKINPWGRTKSRQKVLNRRPTGEKYREWEDEEEWLNKLHNAAEHHNDKGEKEPCIGACYYQKLLNLEYKMDQDNAANQVLQEPSYENQVRIKRSEPCIGLCQYYKSLENPNP